MHPSRNNCFFLVKAHAARIQTEHVRLSEENERLARIVKEQSVTIKTLREELSASAAAVATIATQGTELCKERSESSKLRSSYEMVIDQKEKISKELEEVHGRLKVADQEIRSLRSQARGITTTR
jgi:chromosome segregation ATPase